MGNLYDEKLQILREKTDLNKEIYEQENQLELTKAKRREAWAKERDLMGIIPVYVTQKDLKYITLFVLSRGKPIRQAFDACEAFFGKENWAVRTVRAYLNRKKMTNVLKSLEEDSNEEIAFIKKYDVYDLTIILASDTYRSALLKLMSQYKMAKVLRDKDNELEKKEQLIDYQNTEIHILNKKLDTGSKVDKYKKARNIKLAQEMKALDPNIKLKEIGLVIGKSRQTIAQYLKIEQ